MIDEEQHPGSERFQRRHGGGEALLGRCEFFNFAAIDGLDKCVPGREVTVERTGANAGLPGNIVEAGGSAVAGEDLFGDLKDALAVALGIGAGLASRRWRQLLFRHTQVYSKVLQPETSSVYLSIWRLSPFY